MGGGVRAVTGHSDDGKVLRKPPPLPRQPGQNLYLRLFSRRKSIGCYANWCPGRKLNQRHTDTRSTKEGGSEKAEQRSWGSEKAVQDAGGLGERLEKTGIWEWLRGQSPARGRTKSPELLRNKYIWRRSAMDKPRFKGRTARGSRPSGSSPAWKLGRGSERFRAW